MLVGPKKIIDPPPALKAFLLARGTGAGPEELDRLAKLAAAESGDRHRMQRDLGDDGLIDFAKERSARTQERSR